MAGAHFSFPVFAIYPKGLATHLSASLPCSAFSIWKTNLLGKQIRFSDSLTAAIATNHVSLLLVNKSGPPDPPQPRKGQILSKHGHGSLTPSPG